jgi:hypothetical protein
MNGDSGQAVSKGERRIATHLPRGKDGWGCARVNVEFSRGFD